MKTAEIKEIMECSRALRLSLAVPVMLDHGEAIKLIVADLSAKYHYNANRGDAEWTPIFEKVLSYYLSSEELEALTSPANARAMPPAKD
jgi:hypothetical protein